MRTYVIIVSVLAASASACLDDPDLVGSETAEIAGGTLVPVGELEAVVRLGIDGAVCSATLVSDRVAVTAAHCVCSTPSTCSATHGIMFTNVRPVANPSTRMDMFIAGDVIVHPDYRIGTPPEAPPNAAGTNDLAVIRLWTPASEKVLVQPIPITDTMPAVGSTVTMVAYGPHGNCDVPDQLKRRATTQVDGIVWGPAGDVMIKVTDDVIHGCSGDSGGALLDSQGRLVGVISAGSDDVTLFRAVPAYFEWLGLQGSSPGGRVGAWDLSGTAPAAPMYADNAPDPLGLLGWIDAADLRFTGDFLDRGHDQVLYVNTGGAGGFVRIADYADGVGPTDSAFWLNYGTPSQFSGLLDANDVKLVGDFLARGHDQLLLINNSGSGRRVVIVDFASGTPQFTLFESYGQSNLLNGWHDPGDGFLAGDFFGTGHDAVLFVNRGPGAGRILIADFRDGATPIEWGYYEAYSDGTQLNGWHDAGDLMFAGDFRDMFRDQVMFINRGAGNRVLIVDFGDATFPAEWQLLLSPTQATALDGFIDTEDVALAGEFRIHRDQLALINRSSSGLDRIRVADFSGSGIGIPFTETLVATSGLVPRAIHATDRVLAGDVAGIGTDQLVTVEVLEQ
jgi:hypothetical protein